MRIIDLQFCERERVISGKSILEIKFAIPGRRSGFTLDQPIA